MPTSRLSVEARRPLAMTKQELRAFFKPHLRAEYPASPASGTTSCGQSTDDSTLFVSLAGIRAWSEMHVLPERESMARLLSHNIWAERFRRNYGLFSPQDMARLLRSRVLVLGCGGLGGHVSELLARMGAGFLRLVDNDVFEESNLNRQRFCTESALGRPKAFVVRESLADTASHLEAEALQVEANEHNLPDLVRGMDVALDCLDNITAKAALEKASLAAGVPFVHGSILRDEGFAYVNAGPRPRLAELYPQGQSSEELARARREGVGTLAPAAVACLMIRLCLRALLFPPQPLNANVRHAVSIEKSLTAGSFSAQSEDASTGLSIAATGGPPAVLSPLYHLDMSVPELERFFWD